MNLLMKRMEKATLRIMCVVLFVAGALSTHAQTARQLKIEVRPNQQIWITASAVSYGDVLRALHEKLGWEIEIPALADRLKISEIRIEAKQPQDVLAKLLAGSGLGYAFQSAADRSHTLKVVVIPSTGSDAEKAQNTILSLAASDNAKAGALPSTTQAQAAPTQSNGPTSSPATERPQPASTMSLSDAINIMGIPSGVSPDEAGRMTKFSISDAAQVLGVPPGVSPNDVGRVTTLPLSDAAKMIGVPSGISPSDVGNTLTLPLPTGSGKRP